MKIAIASDHAGFALKQTIIEFLNEQNFPCADLGTYSDAPVDYPDYAQRIGVAVAGGEFERGVLLCGSGVGASVAANKIKGVRAGLCHDTYSAHQGVEHDAMNILVMGARIVGTALAKELVEAFLAAEFTGEERHARRLGKIGALEDRFDRGKWEFSIGKM